MKKKRTKKFLIRRIIAIFVVFVLVLSIKNRIYRWQVKHDRKQIHLVLNQEEVSLKNPIYVEDSVIYLAEEEVKDIFDSTIYYNVGDEELITTYNKHVAVLHLGKPQMIVNDTEIAMQGMLKEIDSKIYLPISDLKIVYDLEIEYIPKTNLVLMDSTTKSKKQALALNNANVTLRKNPFSVSVEKVKRGDSLVILEENGRYQKVRTANGNIGYIKSKKVSEQEIVREDWKEEKFEASDFEKMDDLLVVTKEQVNMTNISTAFATYSLRNDYIKSIYQQVMQNQYKGVYIDFEEIDDVNCFYRFLIELSPKFKESGLKVVVKMKQQLDKKRVKNIVDFIIE